MLRLARNLETGHRAGDPVDPDNFRTLPLQVTTPDGDFGTVWRQHFDQYRSALAVLQAIGKGGALTAAAAELAGSACATGANTWIVPPHGPWMAQSARAAGVQQRP